MKYTGEKENKHSNLKFGLNQGFYLTEFKIVEENNSAYLLIELKKGDIKINKRYYTISDNLDEKTREKEEYLRVRLIIKLLIEITNKTEDELKQIFAKDISEIDFMKLATSLVPSNIKNKKFDIFLQYQYNIRDNVDRTFLELPRNVSQGIFLTEHREGDWKEVRDEDGLHYVNSKGEKHPFSRSKWFLEQNWSIQQKKDNSKKEDYDFPDDVKVNDMPF